MIKLLPFILIPVLILGGLGYWRFMASKPPLTTAEVNQTEASSVEIPKTLPATSLEDRMQSLEDALVKLQANPEPSDLKTNSSGSLDSRIQTVESAVTELKARVSALEKVKPAPAAATSAQASVYIPLGSGGGPWGDKSWYSTAEYEISLDPGNYPGYKGMVLEVTFRLLEAVGTGSVRLYNVTDSSAIGGQVDTTSSSFSLKTSSSFTLPSGTKTYKLQVKSSDGTNLYIQSARIKVNF